MSVRARPNAPAPCAYCGKPTTAVHSGVNECAVCWDWRKLEGPAASHWARVATEFLSNIDGHDFARYFPACGLKPDDVKTMIESAQKIKAHSEKRLAEMSDR